MTFQEKLRKIKNETWGIGGSLILSAFITALFIPFGSAGEGAALPLETLLETFLTIQVVGRLVSASSYFAKVIDIFTQSQYSEVRTLLTWLFPDLKERAAEALKQQQLNQTAQTKTAAPAKKTSSREGWLIIGGMITGLVLSAFFLAVGDESIPGMVSAAPEVLRDIIFAFTTMGLFAAMSSRMVRIFERDNTQNKNRVLPISFFKLSILLAIALGLGLTLFSAIDGGVTLAAYEILKFTFLAFYMTGGLVSGLHYVGKSLDFLTQNNSLTNIPKTLSAMARKMLGYSLTEAENKQLSWENILMVVGIFTGILIAITLIAATGGVGAAPAAVLPAVMQTPWAFIALTGTITGLLVRIGRVIDQVQLAAAEKSQPVSDKNPEAIPAVENTSLTTVKAPTPAPSNNTVSDPQAEQWKAEKPICIEITNNIFVGKHSIFVAVEPQKAEKIPENIPEHACAIL